MKTSVIAAACCFVVLATASRAQVPSDIAAKVRAAGQAMDPTVGQLYAPLFPKEAWAGVNIQRDIAYGSDPLQKLDVFTPDGATGRNLPVLLFVHGGGFTRGDKHGPFYPDNITLWAAKNGMVGVNIDYRLAPKDPWPAGVNDLTAAIALGACQYRALRRRSQPHRAVRPFGRGPTMSLTMLPIPRCVARRRRRSKV